LLLLLQLLWLLLWRLLEELLLLWQLLKELLLLQLLEVLLLWRLLAAHGVAKLLLLQLLWDQSCAPRLCGTHASNVLLLLLVPLLTHPPAVRVITWGDGCSSCKL
jgi:hypothetical protein